VNLDIGTYWITGIEAEWDIQLSGFSAAMVQGQAWRVTARPGIGSNDTLVWTGTGECPWRVNQKLLVTVAPYPEEEQ
jgi:hypothetical protein